MILLLAGTAEARALAQVLADAGVPTLASLAGATRDPLPMAVPTRVGGFGGDAGFGAFLDATPIAAVIDAAHPFAAHVTERTFRICAERGLPHLRLERPGWVAGPGDRWTLVGDVAEAKALIPPGAVAFLATGRQSLPDWAGLGARAWLRVIEPPESPFPLDGGWVVGRPPFDRAAEAAELRRLGVTHLVAKDSGGAGREKLDAARDLGVEVLLIRRPPRPAGMRVAATVAEAAAWARRLGPPLPPPAPAAMVPPP